MPARIYEHRGCTRLAADTRKANWDESEKMCTGYLIALVREWQRVDLGRQEESSSTLMSIMNVKAGYSTPMLHVADIENSIRFYELLGFTTISAANLSSD